MVSEANSNTTLTAHWLPFCSPWQKTPCHATELSTQCKKLPKDAIIEQFGLPNTSSMVSIVVCIKHLKLYLWTLYVERKVGIGLPKSHAWRTMADCTQSAINQLEKVHVLRPLKTTAAAVLPVPLQPSCINTGIKNAHVHWSFLLMFYYLKEYNNKNLTFWSCNGTEQECDHTICPNYSD